MAKHRPRRQKNDKIPYYIVGALVLIFIVVAFPKTGLFTAKTETVGQGSVEFSCDSVDQGLAGVAGSCDTSIFEEGNNVVALVKFEDIENIAGIDFELKTNYGGEELIDLDSVSLEKNCINQDYFECTEDSHCYGKCSENECVSAIPTWNPGEESECFVTNQDEITDCDSTETITAFTCPEINVANQNLDAGEKCDDRYYKTIMYIPSDSGIEVDDDYAYVKDTVLSASSVGFVVSESGSLFKTTDGGETWVYPQIGIDPGAKDLFMIDSNTVFVVGMNRRISKVVGTTTHSGQPTIEGTNPQTTYNSVFFANSNVGYIVGTGGVITKTTDRGSTWTAQTSGTTENLNDVWFKSATDGMAVGDAGTVLHTTDGGSTWSAAINYNADDFTQNTDDLFAITYPQDA